MKNSNQPVFPEDLQMLYTFFIQSLKQADNKDVYYPHFQIKIQWIRGVK